MNEIKSIQELENIDISKYKEEPSTLIGIAKNLQNFQKYDKSIEILYHALKFIIIKNNNSEEALDCAKYYHHYGSAVLRKLMDNNEVFQNTLENSNNKKNADEDEKNTKLENDKGMVNEVAKENDNTNNKENGNLMESNTKTSKSGKNFLILTIESETEIPHEENKDNKELNDIIITDEKKIQESNLDTEDFENDIPEEVEEADDDEEIVFLNLSVADKIYSRNLEKYNSFPANEISEEVKNLFFDRSNNLLCLGELEMHKSDFQAAVEYFLQALEIIKKYANKNSREEAEIYFLLAGANDYDIKKSLVYYYKTKLLMEYHLKIELNKLSFHKQESWEEKIDEIKLDFEEIDEKKIVLDKKLIQAAFGDNQQVSDLRDILTELYEKVIIKLF